MTSNTPSWVSPSTGGQVRRSQYLADAIRQMQADRTPESYSTATSTVANVLSDAILGYSRNQADRDADKAIAADRTRVGDMIRGQFPSQQGIANQQLGQDQAFDLTPGANEQRAKEGGIGDLASLIFQTTGDPGEALKFGLDRQQAMQPDYQFLQGPDGSITLGEKGSGKLTPLQPGVPKPRNPMAINNRLVDPETGEVIGDYSSPEKPQTYNTGQAIVQVGPDGKAHILYRDPQQAGAGGVSFQSLTPDQVRARGYAPGTVVQIDSRGKEYVTGRPSAAQTGQPTEGERSAALHAQISMHGLDKLTEMEGRGYNRAGVMEQMGGVIGGEPERLYDQAAAEFIDGYLRAMTGAAATNTEIDTYRKQWFPQWGDTPAVIQQKADGRLEALRAMKSKVGRAWKPEWDSTMAALGGADAGIGASAGAAGLNAFQQMGSQPQLDPNDDAFIDSLFPAEDGDGVPDGVDPEDWKYFTPEMKQQYLQGAQ